MPALREAVMLGCLRPGSPSICDAVRARQLATGWPGLGQLGQAGLVAHPTHSGAELVLASVRPASGGPSGGGHDVTWRRDTGSAWWGPST